MIGFFLPDLLLYNAGPEAAAADPAPARRAGHAHYLRGGRPRVRRRARSGRAQRQGPLAAEFARALQEMQIGKSRSEALRAMADRTTVPELRAFVSAMIQAAELGIPVAQVLREQAKEMRVRRRQRAEGQAQKIPVKITFPLILCLFPALLVVIIGPGIIEIAHSLFGH